MKNIKEKNPSTKALAYQLYENNGVIKREQVSEYLDKLDQNERKKYLDEQYEDLSSSVSTLENAIKKIDSEYVIDSK